jgi:replication-associated recombination protein RarA
MSYRMFTKRGYDLFDVASALQKSIRRGDAKTAGYFALELEASGYTNYLWKRLFVISAEDIAGCVTQEILALHSAYVLINKGIAKGKAPKGRIFISKAAILLSEAYKCRDADHLIIYLYDQKGITDERAKALIEDVTESDRKDIPEYAFDCHTARGKAMGKTKEDFLKAEFESLKPRIKGLFDDLLDERK